jgi:hypothetical protein
VPADRVRLKLKGCFGGYCCRSMDGPWVTGLGTLCEFPAPICPTGSCQSESCVDEER